VLLKGTEKKILGKSEYDNNSIRVQGVWDSRVQAGRKKHLERITDLKECNLVYRVCL
jgi:hypothetical protein